MEQKKRFPVFAIIMIIIGVGLILFGIIGPRLIFDKSKDVFKVEMDFSGFEDIEAKIELNTSKDINTNIVVFVDDEEYSVQVKEINNGVYKGSLPLSRDDHFFTNEEDFTVKVMLEGGEELFFELHDSFGDATNSTGKIVVTVFSVFFGVVISIVGLMLGLTIKNSGKIKRVMGSAVSAVSGAVSKVADAVVPSRVQKYCEYCHADNDHKAVKCIQCGAPLSSEK